jgi:hypothetical protein
LRSVTFLGRKMSKFKIKMKLTGFELEIEGSKDDVPNIQQALSNQLSGLLQPPAGLIEEAPRPEMKTIEAEPAATAPRSTKPRKRSTPSAPRSTGSETEVALDNWPRDVSKYVSPTQAWSTREKALWVLYVAQEENIASEVSSIQIRDTFNLHYRQAKPINVSQINRDLGRMKGQLVGEDVKKSPPCWFLMEAGTAAVAQRIKEAKEGQAK